MEQGFAWQSMESRCFIIVAGISDIEDAAASHDPQVSVPLDYGQNTSAGVIRVKEKKP